MQKNRSSQQYYSLTPKKINFNSEQPEQQAPKTKKRLSALLTSLNIAYSQLKQKEAAIQQRYYQKSYKNYIRISDIRRDLEDKSRRMWSRAVNFAKKAWTASELERVVELANRAVEMRVKVETRSSLQCTFWK